MHESALLDLMNASRDRMSFSQKRLWDIIKIGPEKWTHLSFEGHDFWVVALFGRSIVSYNDFENGFDRSEFIQYGEIAELGWGQAALDEVVQHILNEMEVGYRTAPRASPPHPGCP